MKPPISSIRNLVHATAVLAGVLASAGAAPIDFARDIAPILEANCAECHNRNLHKGDVSLATPADFTGQREGLESVLVPGHPEKSALIEAISGPDPDMPKEKDPLTASQVETLRRWIAAGAPWPEGFVLREPSAADKSWWSLQPLGELQIADCKSQIESSNHIDNFVREKLSEQGLEMNPPASPRDLVRRVYYDLTGLPPTPAQVAAFLKQSTIYNLQSAMTQIVNELLANPRYGER